MRRRRQQKLAVQLAAVDEWLQAAAVQLAERGIDSEDRRLVAAFKVAQARVVLEVARREVDR